MRLGILADIHEHVDNLWWAIGVLKQQAVDRMIVLGDVFCHGKMIDETVELLLDHQVGGVWGNHDLGLVDDVEDSIGSRFGGQVLQYFGTLEPKLLVDDACFVHANPIWDPTDPEIYYLGQPPYTKEGASGVFETCPQRLIFVGHYHRWHVTRHKGNVSWNAMEPLQLTSSDRYLVVIHAVTNGYCALYDFDQNLVVPFQRNG